MNLPSLSSVLLLPLFVTSAVATPVSFQQGVDGYMGTLDKSILAAGSDATNGEDASFGVDGSPLVHALIRFEDIFGNNPGQIPLNDVVINSASLSLLVTNGGPSVSIYQMLTDWDETATWAVTFGGDGITLGVDAASSPLDTVAPFSTGVRTLDVTAAVAAWSTGSTNYGLGLITTSPDGVAFHSSENTTSQPLLSVDYTVVPEPSCVALALATCWAALSKQRRQ